ncbi:MAG: hypothetical protein SW019_12930 [Actinomycetota bacterium]|nr:hypothetical protein [Actinomycetota bacterium]
MAGVERTDNRRPVSAFHYGLAAIAVLVGVAAAPAPAVAWADSAGSETSTSSTTAGGTADRDDRDAESATHPGSDEAGDRQEPATIRSPRSSSDHDAATLGDDDTGTLDTDTDTDEGTGTGVDQIDEIDLDEIDTAVDPGETGAVIRSANEPEGADVAAPPDDTDLASAAREQPTPQPADAEPDSISAPEAVPAAASSEASRAPVRTPAMPGATASGESAPVTGSAAVEETDPRAPEPLSPLAEFLELPGRLVNEVLQAFGFTSSADAPQSPITLAPINDLLFAAFRELERLAGLDRQPAGQPVVPALVYTGPTTTPTPTVAQFLNASAAGYGLGTTPGGLTPFTVDGFQMSSTNLFSGMVARVWTTPEHQIIIAYQGTTGGTHLLFNPLITVSQVLADLQVIFTPTTPQAFHDALHFARRVQDEAAEQGYEADDIFVTGHSLGGWEAQYVAQQIGLAGIGFESPGMNTVVPGNGADSMFVNIGTYGSAAPILATDLPGLQPFMPPYVPGGGSKPHYGPIVMIGDPAAAYPLQNASRLWGTSIIGSFVFLVDFLGNFFQYHLPGVQAYHLDVVPDPGVVPWLGTARGPVHTDYGTLTIPQLLKASSDDGILFQP